jgi:hypothetical protein
MPEQEAVLLKRSPSGNPGMQKTIAKAAMVKGRNRRVLGGQQGWEERYQ